MTPSGRVTWALEAINPDTGQSTLERDSHSKQLERLSRVLVRGTKGVSVNGSRAVCCDDVGASCFLFLIRFIGINKNKWFQHIMRRGDGAWLSTPACQRLNTVR